MRKLDIKLFIGLLIILPFAFSACVKDKVTRTYTIYTPIYKSKTAVLAEVGSRSASTVKNPGKIYQYGTYIFLNEIGQGVHVIDNANPSSPVRVAFINIPGNLDVAVSNNTLYADMYTDMLAIDITNPLHASVKKKIADAFPERNWGYGFTADPANYIVDWVKKDTTVSADDNNYCMNCQFFNASPASAASSAPKSTTGVGGSMARFAIVNDFLYAVNTFSLAAYDIANRNDPQKKRQQTLPFTIETVYPFQDKLFLGSSSGMFIFDISSPDTLQYRSTFSHAKACDPVIADNSYAYITLRTGTFCGGNTSNQLDVVNVENVVSPRLIKTYQLTNPQGLSKEGNMLWVCDGKDGVKLFNASVPSNLVLLKTISGIDAYDVILSSPGKMIVTAKEGLYQYDYSNLNDIRLLSKIAIKWF